ncbi:hypothetical protein G7062_06605 [Erysipelothrix sp. HDW6C]|uniref:hypothetical protein n=1 Tax=Erysipelothrix sp. HDW6C TaxID=2714930 RepID=UPI00140A7495|nr:hypothetical protein [Erysipelothrix sp. HDW6C]QIK69978.1 hypothetical protein G7062_06605 [Erysipelothrix sp. HDW6C]
MAYSVDKIEPAKMWLAITEFTIPDFSKDLDSRAMQSIRSELKRLGVKLRTPEYNFIIGYDTNDRVELVDIKLFVAVDAPGEGTTSIKFIEQPEEEIIRIVADSFEDVHTGLAEWMHDNDYIAAGDVRRVLVDDETKHVFDSPVKRAED